MITTTYHGIEYTHRLLWQIVEDQVALAVERGDRGGWFGPSLVAMVFALHTIEAFRLDQPTPGSGSVRNL